MNRFRVVTVGAAAIAVVLGVSMASASNGVSTGTAGSTALARARVISQIRAAEQQAAAAGNTRALVALHRTESAILAQPMAADGKAKGRPSSPPPPCPSAAPNAGGLQPCGHRLPGVPPPCPSTAPNAGGLQPCGHPAPSGSPSPSASASPTAGSSCGPADGGGTAATGVLSGPLYGIGLGISNAGAAPLGDLVQTVACAVQQYLTL